MSSRIRQLIFSLVVIGFVLGLAWILLYSSGYNFNWTQLAWQATGGIRLNVEPKADIWISLLPNGLNSRSTTTLFTHLLPGDYHLAVEASGYLPVNFPVTVRPNETTIIEPLRLWPQPSLQPSRQPLKPPKIITKTKLPIVFQSVLAQYDQPDALYYYLVSERQLIVLDPINHLVMEYTRDGSVITSQQLGADITSMALTGDQLLLINEFSLAVVNVSDHTTETITRLSKPIQHASWLTAPYIAYISDQTLHVIDSRSQTSYFDQIITRLSTPVTALWYEVETETLWLTTDQQVLGYRLLPRS